MPLPIISTPGNAPLVITQGANLYFEIQLWANKKLGQKADLTGCTVTARIRKDFDAASAVLLALACAIPTPSLGLITIKATKAQTLALSSAVPTGTPFTSRPVGIGFWDCDITDASTDQYRIVDGSASLRRIIAP